MAILRKWQFIFGRGAIGPGEPFDLGAVVGDVAGEVDQGPFGVGFPSGVPCRVEFFDLKKFSLSKTSTYFGRKEALFGRFSIV